MTCRQTEILTADRAGIDKAGAMLRAGGLVALPTETVYGLAADAMQAQSIDRIYAMKQRPAINPLIVHVSDLEHARAFARFDDTAARLAALFWPGPLTLVLPLLPTAGLAPAVTAGLDSVAIRVPGHDIARQVIQAAGVPLAMPSANPSGKVSPTNSSHVIKGLSGKIDAILDAGPCPVGVESTIISCTDSPRILRSGGLEIERIEAALNTTLLRGSHEGAITAPGMLASHYAPEGTLRLNVTQPADDEVLLGFGEITHGKAALNLSESGDLHEAAARLFDCLHKLNAMGAKKIAVSPVPLRGPGIAINDRLARAAAPRNR